MAAATARAVNQVSTTPPVPRKTRQQAATPHSRQRAANAASAVAELLLNATPAELDRIERATSPNHEDALDPALWGQPPSRAASITGAVANIRKQFEVRRALERASVGRDEAAELLGTSEQSITNALESHRLLGFRQGRRWLLPVWQFDVETERGMLPGLGELAAVFPGGLFALSAWVQQPNPDLANQAPRQLLSRGKVEPVVSLAKTLTAAGW